MNRGPALVIGLFATMICSWLLFAYTPQGQLGSLGQTNTVVIGNVLPQTYPLAPSGIAHQGAIVYRAAGCAACHTEMVRPKDLGPDVARGWGSRRSVAEDYIFEQPVQLGSVRVGPDLANIGRHTYQQQILQRLYNPQSVAPGTIMPAYPWLFEVRPVGAEPSADALTMPAGFEPPPGMEIVPTSSAIELANYLLSLRQDGYLFVAPPPLPPPTNKVEMTNKPVNK